MHGEALSHGGDQFQPTGHMFRVAYAPNKLDFNGFHQLITPKPGETMAQKHREACEIRSASSTQVASQ